MVDFWTNQCINCIRTLPYVTKGYDTYHEQVFTVIGVHTPELAYEYSVDVPYRSRQKLCHMDRVQYEYWPAEYMIDKNGIIRKTHFGEGEYAETEKKP